MPNKGRKFTQGCALDPEQRVIAVEAIGWLLKAKRNVRPLNMLPMPGGDGQLVDNPSANHTTHFLDVKNKM